MNLDKIKVQGEKLLSDKMNRIQLLTRELQAELEPLGLNVEVSEIPVATTGKQRRISAAKDYWDRVRKIKREKGVTTAEARILAKR